MNYDFIDYLSAQFQKRCSQDSDFSLRKFAKELNLEPSQLSKIFNKQRKISISMFNHLADYFQLDGGEREQFLIWVKNTLENKISFAKVNLDNHRAIIIAQALKIPRFSQDPGLLCEILEISEEDLLQTISLLADKKIIKKNDSGNYVLSSKNIFTSIISPRDVQTVFQYLARGVLDYPKNQTTFLYSFIPLSACKLPEYKEKIKELHAQLLYWSSQNNDNPDEIYQLCLGFCPRIN